MNELVFLLEEPSAKDLLQGLLPRILPFEVPCRYVVFAGKQDLEKGMARKLRAWQSPGARFVVLRDQDSGDCRAVKAGLVQRCKKAHKSEVLVRVACRELEAWIAGDLDAFSEEFSCPQARRQASKSRFSNPDSLVNPVTELRKLHPQYQKRDGARRMGKRLMTETNQSPSFQAFCSGLLKLIGG